MTTTSETTAEPRLTPALTIATVLTYAAGYPLGSASVAAMPPGLVILIRFVASAVVLWGLVLALRVPLPNRRLVKHAAVAGVMTQGVQFLALYWALSQGVSAGLSSLIVALNPVATAVLLSVLTKHRESTRGLVSLGFAIAAVVIACAPQIIADHSLGAPLIAVAVALLGLSLGGIYQGSNVIGVHPMVVTAIGVTASIPLAGLWAFFEPSAAIDWPRSFSVIAVMVVISSVGATTLYASCIARAGARAASILFSAIPATAAVMAWIALGDDLSWFAIAGIVLGAAACLIQATERKA